MQKIKYVDNVSRTNKNKCSPSMCTTTIEAEFLDEIQTKVLRIFLIASHIPLYSFALRDFYFFKLTQPLTYFFKLTQAVTISSFYSKAITLYRSKKENLIENHNPPPPPYVLRNPYRNLKSENSQDYTQKPQRNCTFVNSFFVIVRPTVPVSAKPSKPISTLSSLPLFLFPVEADMKVRFKVQ